MRFLLISRSNRFPGSRSFGAWKHLLTLRTLDAPKAGRAFSFAPVQELVIDTWNKRPTNSRRHFCHRDWADLHSTRSTLRNRRWRSALSPWCYHESAHAPRSRGVVFAGWRAMPRGAGWRASRERRSKFLRRRQYAHETHRRRYGESGCALLLSSAMPRCRGPRVPIGDRPNAACGINSDEINDRRGSPAGASIDARRPQRSRCCFSPI